MPPFFDDESIGRVRQIERIEGMLRTILVFIVLVVIEGVAIGIALVWLMHDLSQGFGLK